MLKGTQAEEEQEKFEENNRELSFKIRPNIQEILKSRVTSDGGNLCFCYEQQEQIKTNMLAMSPWWQYLTNTLMVTVVRPHSSGKVFIT